MAMALTRPPPAAFKGITPTALSINEHSLSVPAFKIIPKLCPRSFALLATSAILVRNKPSRNAHFSAALGTGGSPLPSTVNPSVALVNSLLQLSTTLKESDPDLLRALPGDLQVDLKDAAFDISKGQLQEELGEEVGEAMAALGRALERGSTADAAAAASLISSTSLPTDSSSLSALGRRLVLAGRRFTSMGVYGEGRLQKIAKAFSQAGAAADAAAAAASPVAEEGAVGEGQSQPYKTLKVGPFDVVVTVNSALLGAAVGIIFGLLSWQLGASVQEVEEENLVFTSVNSTAVARSLRGLLLTLGYGSSILSFAIAAGLTALAVQISSSPSSDKPAP